jgi:hypothetical protein
LPSSVLDQDLAGDARHPDPSRRLLHPPAGGRKIVYDRFGNATPED